MVVVVWSVSCCFLHHQFIEFMIITCFIIIIIFLFVFFQNPANYFINTTIEHCFYIKLNHLVMSVVLFFIFSQTHTKKTLIMKITWILILFRFKTQRNKTFTVIFYIINIQGKNNQEQLRKKNSTISQH